MFLVQVFVILYTTSHTILYTISIYINVLYRIPNLRYRIRHLKNLLYRMFLVQVFAIFVYDVVYDIVYNIVIFADIVYDMQNLHHYYTISHAYIYIVCTVTIIRYRRPKSIKTYDDTVRYRIRFFFQVPEPAFAAGRTGHAPGAPTDPASWSSALPDSLYCIITVLRPFPQSGMCYCQCEWWQPCTSKNGNFKLKSGGIVGPND
jgi:hypothetical protein